MIVQKDRKISKSIDLECCRRSTTARGDVCPRTEAPCDVVAPTRAPPWPEKTREKRPKGRVGSSLSPGKTRARIRSVKIKSFMGANRVLWQKNFIGNFDSLWEILGHVLFLHILKMIVNAAFLNVYNHEVIIQLWRNLYSQYIVRNKKSPYV